MVGRKFRSRPCPPALRAASIRTLFSQRVHLMSRRRLKHQPRSWSKSLAPRNMSFMLADVVNVPAADILIKRRESEEHVAIVVTPEVSHGKCHR